MGSEEGSSMLSTCSCLVEGARWALRVQERRQTFPCVPAPHLGDSSGPPAPSLPPPAELEHSRQSSRAQTPPPGVPAASAVLLAGTGTSHFPRGGLGVRGERELHCSAS